jgi:lysyl-tRNA synthetase class 2
MFREPTLTPTPLPHGEGLLPRIRSDFPMSETDNSLPQDENKLIAERREKLRALQAQGIAFPNDFTPDAFAGDLQADFDYR